MNTRNDNSLPSAKTETALSEAPRSLNPLVGLAPAEVLKTIGEIGEFSASNSNALLEQSASLARELSAVMSGLSQRKAQPSDKRFRHPQWQENPVFRTQMQVYLAWSEACASFVDSISPDREGRDRARFVVNLMTSACSPSNTLLGNPAALEKAVNSGGLSVLAGFWNMANDAVGNNGMPALSDTKAFEIGGNLGISPGHVVFKTPLIELIQYTPTTPQVHARPQMIVPPVVNKAYLIDMAPGRSVVEYLRDQGLTVFVVSWRNPQPEHRDWGLDAYVSALLEAAQAIRSICDSDTINAHGICGGARILALMLGVLAARQEKLIYVASMIVVNLITDEDSPGLFASPEAIASAKQKSELMGVMDSADIVQAFTWARPADLVWNYWVNNYLLGNPPPAHDVLFWTADTNRLPSRLHCDLLDIYIGNLLSKPGQVTVLGESIDLGQVDCEQYVVGGISDHISPWDRAYESARLFGGPFTFVLNIGGHIQTIINPPGSPRQRYLIQPQATHSSPEAWLESAESHTSSWWEDWTKWISDRSGPKLAAPSQTGNSDYPPGDPAPGQYMRES